MMGVSCLFALLLCFLGAVSMSSPAASEDLWGGALRVTAALEVQGRSFGLASLAILCALLLPLYLGFSGLDAGRGSQSTEEAQQQTWDELHEALAVQDVREDLIFLLALGGAVTGWLLLPIAVANPFLALPLLIVIGTLCCLAVLREKTAAYGLMRDLRAQQARRGLHALFTNLGTGPHEESTLRAHGVWTARACEVGGLVAVAVVGSLALTGLFTSAGVVEPWVLAFFLASYFTFYISIRTVLSRINRVRRARVQGYDQPPRRLWNRPAPPWSATGPEGAWDDDVIHRRKAAWLGMRQSEHKLPLRFVGTLALDVTITAMWALMIGVFSESLWAGVLAALSVAVGVFVFGWWRPRQSKHYRVLLIRATYQNWLIGPFARRMADEDSAV